MIAKILYSFVICLGFSFNLYSATSNCCSSYEVISLSENQFEKSKRVIDQRNLFSTFSSNGTYFDYAYSDFSDTYLRSINITSGNECLYHEPHIGNVSYSKANDDWTPMVGYLDCSFYNVYSTTYKQYYNFSSRGTGFIIGKNMVLTAGHVVYCDGIDESLPTYLPNYNEKFVDMCRFYPNYKNGNSTYYSAKYIIIDDLYYFNGDPLFQANSNYQSLKNFDHDWALLIFNENIGDNYGSIGFNTNQETISSNAQIFGYPKYLNFNSNKLTLTSTYFLNNKRYGMYDNNLNYVISGISGGPIISTYSNNLPVSYGICVSQGLDDYHRMSATKINNYINSLGESYGNGYY